MNTGKILIVEDDKPLRDLLSLRLQEHGYEIITAGDGKQAIALCKEKKPHLMLLDVNLPDILGVDIAEMINASKKEFGPPKIIVITGIAYSVDDPKTRWEREYGVFDFVAKPFDFEELLKKIENALQK